MPWREPLEFPGGEDERKEQNLKGAIMPSTLIRHIALSIIR
jgi:hypothetical protein